MADTTYLKPVNPPNIMTVKESFELLKKSEEYKEFERNEKGFYFVHAIKVSEHNKPGKWEFGFYNPDRDKITTFETNPYVRQPEQDAFKKDGIINELDMNNVQIPYEMAMTLAEEQRVSKFNSEPVTKTIALLQTIHKQVWNITLVTAAFSLINVRIDAATAEIISSSKSSIMDLGVR